MGSLSSGNQALARCAFLGTNPADEPITSGLPVIHNRRQAATGVSNFPQPANRGATSNAHTSFQAEAEYAKLK
jgi:hypothetical protein